MKESLAEPNDVLFRIQRGLAGYISYLAACEMNESFSEYLLYEPILRIFAARGYSVKCEVECPGILHAATGDKKKIDFVAKGYNLHFALEVKWARSGRQHVEQDYLKLAAFQAHDPDVSSFLCVFGRRSHIDHLRLLNDSGKFREISKPVFAEFTKTRFGCRMYKLRRVDEGSITPHP